MIIIFLLVLTFAEANQIHYNIIKELLKWLGLFSNTLTVRKNSTNTHNNYLHLKAIFLLYFPRMN